MAEQKNSSNKTTKKTTTTKKSSSSSWGINKISFYAIGAVAVLYLISTILGLLGVNLKIVSVLEAFATAIIIKKATRIACNFNVFSCWGLNNFVFFALFADIFF